MTLEEGEGRVCCVRIYGVEGGRKAGGCGLEGPQKGSGVDEGGWEKVLENVTVFFFFFLLLFL